MPISALLIPSLDHVCCFLGNSIQRRCQVTADLERNNRSINDANIAGTIDSEVGVYHAPKLTRHHSSRRDVMEVGAIYNVVLVSVSL